MPAADTPTTAPLTAVWPRLRVGTTCALRWLGLRPALYPTCADVWYLPDRPTVENARSWRLFALPAHLVVSSLPLIDVPYLVKSFRAAARFNTLSAAYFCTPCNVLGSRTALIGAPAPISVALGGTPAPSRARLSATLRPRHGGRGSMRCRAFRHSGRWATPTPLFIGYTRLTPFLRLFHPYSRMECG